MQNKFPKTPILISVIILCLLLLAFFHFYRIINKNNQEAESLEVEWHKEVVRRDEIRTLDNSVKMIETEKQQLETHFAQSSDVVPFLNTIEGLAGAKAEVTSLDIPTDHAGLLVGMKASGTFAGLYKFLTLLENSPYELEFVSMDLQKDTSTSNWNAILKIKLLTFTE